MPEIAVRTAIADDAESILKLMIEFAEFDERPQRVKVNAEQMRQLLASSNPLVQFVIAEADHHPVGFASFYRTFSTAAGEAGLCLEDLYVQENSRRRGVGRSLMRFVAQMGIQTGCTKIEWQVGSENIDGQRFYESIGAPVRQKTRICRMPLAAMVSCSSTA